MAEFAGVSNASQRLYDSSERIPSLIYLLNLAREGANETQAGHTTLGLPEGFSGIESQGIPLGLDYLAITDHDVHVDGAVATHPWADPDFAASQVPVFHHHSYAPLFEHMSHMNDEALWELLEVLHGLMMPTKHTMLNDYKDFVLHFISNCFNQVMSSIK